MSKRGTGQFVHGTLVVLHGELIGIAIWLDDLPIQFTEQVFRTNDVSQMLYRPLLHNRLEVGIGESLFIGKPIFPQNILHIHLRPLGEVTVKNRPKNIVPKLVCIHTATQIVRNCPQLGRKV